MWPDDGSVSQRLYVGEHAVDHHEGYGLSVRGGRLADFRFRRGVSCRLEYLACNVHA